MATTSAPKSDGTAETNVTPSDAVENNEKEAVKILMNDQAATTGQPFSTGEEFEDNTKIPHLSYWEVFLLFLNFGCHAWGGPVAQIANLKERLVDKERWISIERFNRAFAIYQMLPGPEATELAMYFGCLTRGRIGGILAGFGFLIPGFVLILLLSWIYEAYGLENEYFQASFHALQPIVSAMVLRAVHKIGEHACISHDTKKFNYWLFSIAILAALQTAIRINFFITLGVHGLTFMLISRKQRLLALLVLVVQFGCYATYVALKGWPGEDSLSIGVARTPDPPHIFALGLMAGLVSFGGAYTTIPFLRAEGVTIGKWITEKVFLDGVAVGNVLPAPLVTFSCFIGFQGGHTYGGMSYAFIDGILITIGIFLPCFLFTIIGHEYLERLSRVKVLAAFFDGITASVVGLIAVTALELLKASVSRSPDVAGLNEVEDLANAVASVDQVGVSAVVYVLALAVLYNVRHGWTPLLLVLLGAISGQFLFV